MTLRRPRHPRARSAGVLWTQVLMKLVDASDAVALWLPRIASKPSCRAEFKAGEDDKTPVYMARWVSTPGEEGPWSEVTTATVAA